MSRLQICTHWLLTRTLQVANQTPSRKDFFGKYCKICSLLRLPDESQCRELPQLPVLLLEPICSWRQRLDMYWKHCRGFNWKTISLSIHLFTLQLLILLSSMYMAIINLLVDGAHLRSQAALFICRFWWLFCKLCLCPSYLLYQAILFLSYDLYATQIADPAANQRGSNQLCIHAFKPPDSDSSTFNLVSDFFVKSFHMKRAAHIFESIRAGHIFKLV